MTHRFPLPDVTHLEQLIVKAYEELPTASQTDLTRIEDRLSRKARLQKSGDKLNKTPWWVVILLTGSFAAAAWWSSQRWAEAPSTPEESTLTVPEQTPERELRHKAETMDETRSGKAQDPEQTTRSGVIYQREY